MKYKNAATLPIRIAINAPRPWSKFEYEIAKKQTKAMIKRPEASPSKPSAILKAFANETITKVAKGIYRNPISVSPIPLTNTKLYPSCV